MDIVNIYQYDNTYVHFRKPKNCLYSRKFSRKSREQTSFLFVSLVDTHFVTCIDCTIFVVLMKYHYLLKIFLLNEIILYSIQVYYYYGLNCFLSKNHICRYYLLKKTSQDIRIWDLYIFYFLQLHAEIIGQMILQKSERSLLFVLCKVANLEIHLLLVYFLIS